MLNALNQKIRDILKRNEKAIEEAPFHFGGRVDDDSTYIGETAAFDNPKDDPRKAWAREDLKGWVEIDD